MMRIKFGMGVALLMIAVFTLTSAQSKEKPQQSGIKKYSDGRPAATLRMDARDYGIVLKYGDGPDQCDILGAREAYTGYCPYKKPRCFVDYGFAPYVVFVYQSYWN